MSNWKILKPWLNWIFLEWSGNISEVYRTKYSTKNRGNACWKSYFKSLKLKTCIIMIFNILKGNRGNLSISILNYSCRWHYFNTSRKYCRSMLWSLSKRMNQLVLLDETKILLLSLTSELGLQTDLDMVKRATV